MIVPSGPGALAWEIHRRHRWGFRLIGLYVLALGVLGALTPSGGGLAAQDEMRFAFTVTVPLSISGFWLLAVFTFGFGADLSARGSVYPERLFTLPVTTSALVAWPMLLGSATMAALWIAADLLALRPRGLDLPIVWPALALAAVMAWSQALIWLPYRVPSLRPVAFVGVLVVADALMIEAVVGGVSDLVMIAAMAPQIPLAYRVARHGVARARRGEVPGVAGSKGRARAAREGASSPRRPFRSAAHAQRWLEWRRTGGTLPALVAMLVPFELLLLFLPDISDFGVLEVVMLALLTPPFLAAVSGATLRRALSDSGDGYGLGTFAATRPVTSARLVAAKLEAALASSAAAWLVAIAVLAVGLALSGTWPVVLDGGRRVADAVGGARALTLAALGALVLVALTWTHLVQSLCIGLSGREWLVRASTAVLLVALVFLWPALDGLRDSPRLRLALWNALPWLPALPVALKMAAAAWVAAALHRTRVVPPRTLLVGAAAWTGTVLALHAATVWWLDTPFVVSYWPLLLIILGVPLVRISAAPLALAWNRHR